MEIATITLSLFYGAWGALQAQPDGADFAKNLCESDFLAFSVIIFLAMTSEARGLRIPSILRTIAEDGTRYFLVIFTLHLVLEMTLNFARVSGIVSPRATHN